MDANEWITWLTFLSVCDSNTENEEIEIEWVLADKN
jgi:hypothetical protein